MNTQDEMNRRAGEVKSAHLNNNANVSVKEIALMACVDLNSMFLYSPLYGNQGQVKYNCLISVDDYFASIYVVETDNQETIAEITLTDDEFFYNIKDQSSYTKSEDVQLRNVDMFSAYSMVMSIMTRACN